MATSKYIDGFGKVAIAAKRNGEAAPDGTMVLRWPSPLDLLTSVSILVFNEPVTLTFSYAEGYDDQISSLIVPANSTSPALVEVDLNLNYVTQMEINLKDGAGLQNVVVCRNKAETTMPFSITANTGAFPTAKPSSTPTTSQEPSQNPTTTSAPSEVPLQSVKSQPTVFQFQIQFKRKNFRI